MDQERRKKRREKTKIKARRKKRRNKTSKIIFLDPPLFKRVATMSLP